MTREEAKHRLLNIERSLPNTFRTKEDVRNFEALEMAIKALEQNESAEEWYKLFVEKLEQEPKILDKIRVEIDGIEINGQIDKNTMFIRTGENVKQMALDIIDKYTKGESEVWNSPNADNRIEVPKGTFKKIYEDEDDDNDI